MCLSGEIKIMTERQKQIANGLKKTQGEKKKASGYGESVTQKKYQSIENKVTCEITNTYANIMFYGENNILIKNNVTCC